MSKMVVYKELTSTVPHHGTPDSFVTLSIDSREFLVKYPNCLTKLSFKIKLCRHFLVHGYIKPELTN